MKKTLLSLLCAAVGVFTAAAADVTDVLTNDGFGIGKTTNYNTYSDKSFASDAVYTMQGAGQDGTLQLRSSNNNSGIVSTVSGGTLVSVSVKWSTLTTNTSRELQIYGSNTAYTAPTDLYDTAKQGTLLGSIKKSEGDKTITVEGEYEFIGLRSKSGAMWLDEVSIVWNAGEITKVSKPQITPNGGEISAETKISLSCSTDAAEIWYAYAPKGTDVATVEKVKYTEPFTIPASGTVEAIAKKEGLTDSDVSTAVFTIPADITVDDIAACVALNNTADNITISGELAVTYVNGINIYAKDVSGAICIYNNTNSLKNIKAGDRLTGVTGKYLKYGTGSKGDAFLPEMQNIDASKVTVTEGEAVAPDVYTAEEIGSDMCGAYVQINDATVAASSITDETGTVTLYNQFKITLELGKAKYLTGIVLTYQGAIQVAPIEIVPDETGEPAEPVKGDKEDPYTVAEALALYEANNSINQTGWVTGYIVGFINGSSLSANSAKFTAEDAVVSNILLADAETETDYTKCLPVQLAKDTAPRTALNLLDNPTVWGSEVKVEGAISKYMGVAGLKSASDYVIVRPTGIENVDNAAKAVTINGMIGAVSVTGFEGTVEIYNILGQLVSATPVSGNATIPARAGIALVKAGNVVAKVIVK